MTKHLQPDDLVALMQEGQRVQVVDVRSPGEYASGHIAGSVNIPMDQVESRMEDLQAHGPVVLACQSGQRAGLVCHLLLGRQRNLYVLDRGTKGWIEDGYSVVRSTRTRWSLERQVRFGAGLLVLTGLFLGVFVEALWLVLAGFVGAGLTFAGLTDICGMGLFLAHMPWNKGRRQPMCLPGGEVQS